MQVAPRRQWSAVGINGLDDNLVSFEFISRLMQKWPSQGIIYGELAFEQISAGSRTITKHTLEAYATGKTGGIPALVKLVESANDKLVPILWSGNAAASENSQHEFAAAFLGAIEGNLAELYECTKAGSATGAVDIDTFTALYYMAWLAAVATAH